MAQVNTDDGLLTQGFFKYKFWEKLLGMFDSLKQDVETLDTDIGKIGGSIAPAYSSLTFPIEEGTLCMYARRLYTCSASGGIPTSEDWTASHWTQTRVSDIIGDVESLLAAL